MVGSSGGQQWWLVSGGQQWWLVSGGQQWWAAVVVSEWWAAVVGGSGGQGVRSHMVCVTHCYVSQEEDQWQGKDEEDGQRALKVTLHR